MPKSLFGSFWFAGFECSTQRRWDQRRLDMIEGAKHDVFCEKDYAACMRHGLKGARDGFRWHLIEKEPGHYDWSSVRPMLRAARRQRITVIWDLCHYGYPDWLDLMSDEFSTRFAAFCIAAVRLIREESQNRPFVCPVNEISFWSWLGGEEGKINPYTLQQGDVVKYNLVRAKLKAIRAIRAADAEAFIVNAEPAINIVPDSLEEHDIVAAAAFHESQYAATDMTLGRSHTELGGHMDALDAVGINYYPHNQWRLRGGYIPLGHHNYRPFSEILEEVYNRYQKPIFIAETGAEHSARASWISYVASEVRAATAKAVPVLGICLYPITCYPGWDNERICLLYTSPSPRD